MIDARQTGGEVGAGTTPECVDDGYDIVFFWKQNDTGIYGRRQDMLVKYLSRSPKVNKIVHFDAPINASTLLTLQDREGEGEMDQSNLVFLQTVSRLLGEKDSEKVKYYTFVRNLEFLRDRSGASRSAEWGSAEQRDHLQYLADVLEKNGIGERRTIFWVCPTTNFDFREVVSAFQPELVVADVIDDQRVWQAPGSPQRAAQGKNYQEVLSLSDVTLANCEPVRQSMLEYSDDVRLVSNALELPEAVAADPKLPRELEELEGPVIGYVGNLSSRIDIGLLEYVAVSRPNWNLVLIGSTHLSKEILRLDVYDNVHFLGVKKYHEAQQYIRGFDVAMIPHLNNEMTQAMNPLKAFVYFSLNVPVVSAEIQNLGEMREMIYVAQGREDFVRKAELALEEERDGSLSAGHMELLRRNSWGERVETILQLIEEELSATDPGTESTGAEPMPSGNHGEGSKTGRTATNNEASMPPLPTFLIIGAQKSGTRWLRGNLHAHPGVFTVYDELSFFNSNDFEKGLDWYRTRFEGWDGEPHVGESTPGYMMWRKDSATLATRINDSLPGVKLIAILRNPVDRAYSAFLHHMRKGRIPTDADLLEWLRSVDASQDKLHLITGGWYAPSLASYVERFGERLKVLMHEEIVSAPDQFYTRALEHIGVSTDFLPEQLQQVQDQDSVPGESNYAESGGSIRALKKPRDLTPEERTEIYEYFRNDIEQLEELLDWDLNLWRPPREKAAPANTETEPKGFGHCEVCGYIGTFQERKESIREGYRCGNCSASLRYRHQAAVMVAKYTNLSSGSFAELVKEPAFQGLHVYEPGIIGPFRKCLEGHPNYTTSYFWEDLNLGESKDGVRCEDLERLTFDDESFDLVISSDIFEHVRKPYEAFAEVYRVLKPGGMHVFTVPLRWPLPESTVSRVDTSGLETVFVLPAVYHGSPTDSKGSLVYTDFGVDVVEDLKSIGFDTKIYRGVRYNVTFCAEKLGEAT